MIMGFVHGPGLLLPFLFLGRFFWLILLGLLIWGLIRLFSRRGRHYYMPPRYNPVPPTYTPGTPPSPSQSSAMEILRQRYARGEIDAATFENMRERLENSSNPGPQ
jgi:putative membrane protein